MLLTFLNEFTIIFKANLGSPVQPQTLHYVHRSLVMMLQLLILCYSVSNMLIFIYLVMQGTQQVRYIVLSCNLGIVHIKSQHLVRHSFNFLSLGLVDMLHVLLSLIRQSIELLLQVDRRCRTFRRLVVRGSNIDLHFVNECYFYGIFL